MAIKTEECDPLETDQDEANDGLFECCVIDRLLEGSFQKLSSRDQHDIIKKGRPTPDISINTKTKNYIRHFKSNYYETTKWLTACDSRNQLFCWPCILFEKEKGVWNCDGYCDINNFLKAKARHEKSQAHLSSMTKLKTFGKYKVDSQSNKLLPINIAKYNAEVEINRDIMKRVIDVCCLLAKQELPFRELKESSDSPNRGNYVQILNTLSKYDPLLSFHFQNPNLFKGTSERIQNDLIESIGNVMVDEIKKEITDAKFVTMMLDETSDIPSLSQLSTIFRYVKDGEIRERFVGFSDVSENRSGSGLSEHVCKILEEYQCTDKIVAQVYDGAATFSGHLNELQLIVKMHYPQAMFIHCYAHRLNLVLSQSMDCIKECKFFFKTLNGFPSFFAHATKRLNESIKSELKRKFPSVCNKKWYYNSKIVNTVYKNKLELLGFFNNIVDDPDKWDSNTFIAAVGFIKILESLDFSFQLEVFNEIFALTDALCNVLQSKYSDIQCCIDKVKETTSLLEEKKDNFILIYSKVENEDDIESPKKRRRDDETSKYLRLCNEIFDTILGQMEVRFNYLKELRFIELIDSKQFIKFKKNFPDEFFISLKLRYKNSFDFTKLRCELMAMYNLSEFSKKTFAEVVMFLKETELADEAFSELYKLCALISTIPNSPATSTFSCLKRVKASVRKAQGENRHPMLSMISIENELHEDIRNRKNFYDLVIEKFLEKGDRGIALVYK